VPAKVLQPAINLMISNPPIPIFPLLPLDSGCCVQIISLQESADRGVGSRISCQRSQSCYFESHPRVPLPSSALTFTPDACHDAEAERETTGKGRYPESSRVALLTDKTFVRVIQVEA
jgi:hypothetical protein